MSRCAEHLRPLRLPRTDLRAVQTLLGRSSVAATERYTAVDADEVRAVMAALD